MRTTRSPAGRSRKPWSEDCRKSFPTRTRRWGRTDTSPCLMDPFNICFYSHWIQTVSTLKLQLHVCVTEFVTSHNMMLHKSQKPFCFKSSWAQSRGTWAVFNFGSILEIIGIERSSFPKSYCFDAKSTYGPCLVAVISKTRVLVCHLYKLCSVFDEVTFEILMIEFIMWIIYLF